MSRRTLITGAGGFVGSFVTAGFVAAGDEVTAIDRAFDPDAVTRLADATLVTAELSAALLAELGRFDLVIHAAAITTASAELGLTARDQETTDSALTAMVLDHARQSGARDFVFISSSGVFHGENGVAEAVESTPTRASSPYARTKLHGEALVAAVLPPLRAIAVRLGPIYGPGERARPTRVLVSPLTSWIHAAAAGQPVLVENAKSCRDWTFGPDLGGALGALLALEPPLRGVVHLTSGEAIGDRELAGQIARWFGVGVKEGDGPATMRRIPMRSERLPTDLYRFTPLAEGLVRVMEAQP